MFESSKVPFTKWFMAIYEFSNDKRGYSAKRLESEVGVNYKTAGLMLHKIRKAMGDRDSDGNHLLGGVVEVDEFYSGATDEGGKHGRGTDKSKVILAVSTTADKKHTLAMRARVEQELSGETAKAFMESNIKRGSPVETDGLSIYNGLSAIGYDHRPRIHDPKGSDLYWMHIVISNIKSFVQGTFHGLDEKYLQRYLDEFTYRFNRRLPGGAILGRLIKSCVMANHMTCSELKG
jgi:transposase-like protein